MQALTLGGSTAAAPPPISHILQNLQDVSPQLSVLMCPQIWGDGSKHARVHLVQDIFDVHLHDLSISHKRRTLAVRLAKNQAVWTNFSMRTCVWSVVASPDKR